MTAALLSVAGAAMAQAPQAAAAANTATNPLIREFTTPEGVPPYDRIKPADYLPAYEEAMRRGRAEIAAIAANRAPATFANTILPLDQGEQLLTRVDATFSNVASADATPEIQAVEEKISPLQARYASEKYQNQALFARVDAVHRNRARLTPEQQRLTEVIHKRFVRSGAALPAAQRARLAAIDERMAAVQTGFGQKLLADQKARDTLLTEAEVAGLSDSAKASAAAKAKAAGKTGYLVTATRSDAESFLTAATNRAAREKVWRAFAGRNDGTANTTYPDIAEMVRLRAERAKLLGYPSHAHFVLDNSMAKTPEAARKLLVDVITPALKKAAAEEADLLKLARADGVAKIEPWDWRFYSDKVRQQRFALNDDEVRQYLRADNVMAAMFDTMTRLYDVTFVPRPDLPVYAPGVQAFQVNRQGQKAGIFFADWFARPTKRAGAWMNELRTQDGVRGLTPIVVNNSNYTPAPQGQVALLSVDDMETSFHEFGHALHGLLSKAKYPTLAGTSVYRDFVEFPSQVHEHWATEPDTLKRFAKNAAGSRCRTS
jgi:peptidyl-dipeptidase Dcp